MKGQVLVYRRLKPIKEKLSCAVGGVGDSGIQRKPGTLASAGISDQSYDNSMRLSNYTVDDVDTIRQLVLSRPRRVTPVSPVRYAKQQLGCVSGPNRRAVASPTDMI